MQNNFLNKPHALNLSKNDWGTWCQTKGYPNYVAGQIYTWIFAKNNLFPLSFSNLSEDKRQALHQEFNWQTMTIDSHLKSQDLSEKILLKTHDDLLIEMVIMPYENRTTLCLSCQVGCKMGCTFCQTGKMGLKRNLTSGEILYQLLLAKQLAQTVTNVVFMGMGEPLDNYQEVLKACQIMIDPEGFGLSKARVTISTSGLIPEIRQLGRDLPVRLAISLHSADETLRSKMMPINKKYPLKDLKEALLEYPAPDRYGITFEYVLIEGVNDTIADAKKLVSYIHGLKVKVNLIPINHFPGIEMHPSKAEKIRAFQSYLTHRSIPAPVRYSRGVDVSGGCGQLAAKRESEIHLDPRVLHKKRRLENSSKSPLQIIQ